MLFGHGLAKTIRGAKDASSISKKLSSGDKKKKKNARHSRHSYRFFDKRKSVKDHSSAGSYKQSFLGKHQKKPQYKKYQADKK